MREMAVIRPLRPQPQSSEPVVESRLQDLVVITGFSGAGKSTLIKALAGVHRPDAGTVLDAETLGSCDERRNQLKNGQLGFSQRGWKMRSTE